jgi:hypothetical protein
LNIGISRLKIPRVYPNYKGGKIRLFSCETGADDAIVAKKLADYMGVEVMAPSDVIWIGPQNSIVIGPRPNINTGEWRTFKPNKKKK